MPTDIDSIIGQFPHPTIPTISDAPTYENISVTNIMLNANAASIHSNLGDGKQGHLSLTISASQYAKVSTVTFVPPTNPGVTAVISDNATAAQIRSITAAHKADTHAWQQYTAVEKALSQQLIAVYNPMYIRALRNRLTGFAGVNTRQILEHLYATYGDISAKDLADNHTKMNTPYDPNLPIENLIDQIDEATELADAAKAPYTAPQIVAIAYNLIQQTGIFTLDCEKWDDKADTDKTWVNFKTFFAASHKKWRRSSTTAQQGGYHEANLLTADTIETLGTLATGIEQDRHTVSTLSADNVTLRQQLEALSTQLASLQANIPQNNSNPRHQQQSAPRTRRRFSNDNYCWSHGWDVSRTHDSTNCRHQKEGHKTEATRSNTMNGSDTHKNLLPRQ